MPSPPKCPSCNTPLGLFTPRDSLFHINACLDANPPSPKSSPKCPICSRDLSPLTPHARLEHCNRCADSTLPLPKATNNHSRSRPRTRTETNHHSDAPKSDEKVVTFLKMLGLERYVSRFAKEEIDIVALRLLKEDDFTHLRIAEGGRRRIAEALKQVHILFGRETEGDVEVEDGETELVITQRFGKSRLGTVGKVEEDDSDGDLQFADEAKKGTQKKEAVSPHTSGKRRLGALDAVVGDEEDSDGEFQFGDEEKSGERDDIPREEPALLRLGSDSDSDVVGVIAGGCSPSVDGIGRNEEGGKGGEKPMLSSSEEDENVSEVSSLRDIEKDMMIMSPISLDAKLQKWKRKQVLRERGKHKKEVERERKRHRMEMTMIQDRYDGMRTRICGKREGAGIVKDGRVIGRDTEEAVGIEKNVSQRRRETIGEGGSSGTAGTSGNGESHSSALLSAAPLAEEQLKSPMSGRMPLFAEGEEQSPSPLRLGMSPTIDLTEHSVAEEEKARDKSPVETRRLFPNPNVIETIVISSTKPSERPADHRARISDHRARISNAELEDILGQYESDKGSKDSVMQSKRIEDPRYKRLFLSSDEDEVMDLTQRPVEKDNVKVNMVVGDGGASAKGEKPTCIVEDGGDEKEVCEREKEVETIVISSTKPSERPAEHQGRVSNGELEEILGQYESDKGSKDSAKQLKRVEDPRYKSLFLSSDEDEVMDLTQRPVEKENVKVNIDVGDGGGQNEVAEGEKEGEETERPRSRLKRKRKKVTSSDVIAAIRQDMTLYDEILMMESVAFMRIFASVKASGIVVSKKALTELLQKEGVSFKPEDVTDRHKASSSSYFQRLNCHSD